MKKVFKSQFEDLFSIIPFNESSLDQLEKTIWMIDF